MPACMSSSRLSSLRASLPGVWRRSLPGVWRPELRSRLAPAPPLALAPAAAVMARVAGRPGALFSLASMPVASPVFRLPRALRPRLFRTACLAFFHLFSAAAGGCRRATASSAPPTSLALSPSSAPPSNPRRRAGSAFCGLVGSRARPCAARSCPDSASAVRAPVRVSRRSRGVRADTCPPGIAGNTPGTIPGSTNTDTVASTSSEWPTKVRRKSRSTTTVPYRRVTIRFLARARFDP